MEVEPYRNQLLSHPIYRSFKCYLERHIIVDGDKHGPAAGVLLQSLCDQQKNKWDEALLAATQAVKMRIHLWNGLMEVCSGTNWNNDSPREALEIP